MNFRKNVDHCFYFENYVKEEACAMNFPIPASKLTSLKVSSYQGEKSVCYMSLKGKLKLTKVTGQNKTWFVGGNFAIVGASGGCIYKTTVQS